MTRKLEVPCYFTDPYSSWQRGTNENTNELLRKYFPRGFAIEKTRYDYVKSVETKLNYRPRKVLDFNLPIQFINAEELFNKNVALELGI